MDPSMIVIADLVGGPDSPPTSVGTRLEDDVAVKNEPAPVFGAPIFEVSARQAPVELARCRRQQPKRQRIEPPKLEAGLHVWHGGTQNGRSIKFKGTVIEVYARTNQCRVRFDDSEEKTVSQSSLHVLAEGEVPPLPPPREEVSEEESEEPSEEEVENDDDDDDDEEEEEEEEAEPPLEANSIVADRRRAQLAGGFDGAHGLVRVKLEDEARSIAAHARLEAGGAICESDDTRREEERDKLLREPGGRPRRTFRAGCADKCITTVLGGSGAVMERTVSNDHVLPDGHVLIKKGEFYLSAAADWNPWAPSFAGDIGMFLYDFRKYLHPNQSEFHVFRECTLKRSDYPYSAYHGPHATRLYCGRYRYDDDHPLSEISFKKLPPCTQDEYVKLHMRREAKKKRKVGTFEEEMARILEENKTFTMHGYEFVDYDEKLYAELVRVGADNGWVETVTDRSDPTKLSPL